LKGLALPAWLAAETVLMAALAAAAAMAPLLINCLRFMVGILINTPIGNFEDCRGNLEGKSEQSDSHDGNP